MRGKNPSTKININDGVSGDKARVHQEKKKNRKEVPFTKEHSNHGRGKAWRMLTALLKEVEVSNKP